MNDSCIYCDKLHYISVNCKNSLCAHINDEYIVFPSAQELAGAYPGLVGNCVVKVEMCENINTEFVQVLAPKIIYLVYVGGFTGTKKLLDSVNSTGQTPRCLYSKDRILGRQCASLMLLLPRLGVNAIQHFENINLQI